MQLGRFILLAFCINVGELSFALTITLDLFRLDCDPSLSSICMGDSKCPNLTCHDKLVVLWEGCSWYSVFNFRWLVAWFLVHRLIVLLVIRIQEGVGLL